MQKQESIVTAAVEGIGVKLAGFYGISVARLYQILEADHYGKTKRLIRCIAAIDKERIKLIKADLDTFFCELLGDVPPAEVDCAYLHGELTDVIQAKLKGLSTGDRLRECLEARSALDAEIASLAASIEKRQIERDVFSNAIG
jgi:hypothetical protein